MAALGPFRSVKIGGRGGSLRWSSDLNTTFDFRKIEEPLLREVFDRTEQLRLLIQETARSEAPWGNNREDGRGRETGRARKNLFAFKQRQKSGIVIGLTHGSRTVSNRGGFPYGIALETFQYERRNTDNMIDGGSEQSFFVVVETEGEGTYAIINPTLQAFQGQVMRRLDGALNEALKGSGVKANRGGSRVFRGR